MISGKTSSIARHAYLACHVCLMFPFALATAGCTKSSLDKTVEENKRGLVTESAETAAVKSEEKAEPVASVTPVPEAEAGATPDRILKTLASKDAVVDLAVDPDKATIKQILLNDQPLDASKTVVSIAPQSAAPQSAARTSCGGEGSVSGSSVSDIALAPNTQFAVTVCEAPAAGATAAQGTPIVASALLTTPAAPVKIETAEIVSDDAVELAINTANNPNDTEVAISVFSEQEEGWLDLKTGKVITDEEKKWQTIPAESLKKPLLAKDGSPIALVSVKVDSTAEPVFVVQARNREKVESSESAGIIAHAKGSQPILVQASEGSSSGVTGGTKQEAGSVAAVDTPGGDKTKATELTAREKLTALRKGLRQQREDMKPLKSALKDIRRDESKLEDDQKKLSASQKEAKKAKDNSKTEELQKKIDEVSKHLADIERQQKETQAKLKEANSSITQTKAEIKKLKIALKKEAKKH